MPTLQKTFLWEGDITHSPIRSLNVRFTYPDFEYYVIGDSNGKIGQKIHGDKSAETEQDVSKKEYNISLPPDSLTGDAGKYAAGFLRYVNQQIKTSNITDNI